MDRAFCANCVRLIEGEDMAWVCDSFGKPIEQIEVCPEEDPEREAFCIEEIADELTEALFEGLLLEEVSRRIELLEREKSSVIDRVIDMSKEKLEDWIVESEVCPACVKERGRQVELVPDQTRKEYMGDYGSERAYQTFAVTVICPVCSYVEEV